MNLKYFVGATLSIPLLPVMYMQAKKIRKRVPKLSEANKPNGLEFFSKNSETLQLISIGESTIAGVGVESHQEGFTGTLASELSRLMQLNISWNVYAKSGYTAKKIREKILPKITESKADLLVIGLGGNDAFTLNTPFGWRREIKRLIHDLHERFTDVPIVFCNMPPIKEFPAFTPLIKFTIGNLVEILGIELNKLIDKYENVYYASEIITLEKWISKLPGDFNNSDFFSDGVHPSKLTYQTWAKETANFINISRIMN